jgi:hypothetical protein
MLGASLAEIANPMPDDTEVDPSEDTVVPGQRPIGQLFVPRIDSIEAATRSLRKRTILSIILFLVGLTIFSLSNLLAIFIYPVVPLRYDFTEPVIGKLGAFISVIGVGSFLLLNYLQLGVFFATPKQVPALLARSAGVSTTTMGVQEGKPAGSSGFAIGPDEESYSRVLTQWATPEGALVQQLFHTTGRLNREIGELGRRGNINLLIGIITTVVGVGILVYVVYSTLGDNEDFGWKSGVHTILRISIALFIQTFAYFFLRLYKTSLEDIKYYQNEITNIESRWLALKAATDKPEFLKSAIDALLKTERNFVLKKGESTLLLERERLEKNEIVDLVKEAMGVVAKVKSTK